MIKYIGSKRKLIPAIVNIAKAIPDVQRFCDIFSGTTRVGQALKAEGFFVHSNDIASYSEVFGRCYIQANRRDFLTTETQALINQLNAIKPSEGYFTRKFCVESRYFQPFNGARIDAIRAEIEKVKTEPLRSILLTSLIEAADRVDSTTGVQMAFLKKWAARSYNKLELRLPDLIDGEGRVTRTDANILAKEMDDIDVCYLDPPYNQHSYYSNYHIWETLVKNDKPESYGIACKRTDCRTTKSPYNSKKEAWNVFADLITSLNVRHHVISFSDEGFHAKEKLLDLLSNVGYVGYLELDYKRYVGAQIGIYNPSGEKVGRVSHLENKEYIFVTGKKKGVVEGVLEKAKINTQKQAAMAL